VAAEKRKMRDAEPQIKPFGKAQNKHQTGKQKGRGQQKQRQNMSGHEYKMRHKHIHKYTENKRMRGHIFHASLSGVLSASASGSGMADGAGGRQR